MVEGWYRLLAYVIMPDHFHIIIIPAGKNASQIMQGLKGYTSRVLNSINGGKGSVWQRGYYDYILDSEEKVLTKIRYIEGNPVRKGLTERAEEYEFSSAGERIDGIFLCR
jgi:putative transposase